MHNKRAGNAHSFFEVKYVPVAKIFQISVHLMRNT